uniref:Inositol-3,4-bisphosphate 4-phosphatase n=1 Tax=Globisporangium ultimum (strain ATCC 200006 / CBS 805.95 / DAOM BR144) TaxID=431595 RepID=K3WHJ1_GLOUD
MKDGNPFINLYSLPGDAHLEIQSVNETYFCIGKLLPTGAGTNTSWEINSDFTFQLQIAGIMWSQSSVVANTTRRFPLPKWFSWIKTRYKEATVHSCFRMNQHNGIAFSGSSFFNDMTSIMVLLVLILGIIGNAIWIHVSSDALTTNSSHIYYVLRQITMCCTWTMMVSVCFHWLLVLSESLRKMRRVYVLLAYIVVNGGYYTYVLYSMITLTDFFKCTYNDYLKNPRYTKRLCDSDYCPDLQPYQWKYATEEVCKYVHDSSWYFPGVYGGEIMIFATGIVLLILGAYVIRRGSRFLVLQWNPRLHGMNWNPSLHVKERTVTKDNLGEKGWADGKMENLSETWTGISNFPDTEYAPIGAESIDGNQNILALSIQLAWHRHFANRGSIFARATNFQQKIFFDATGRASSACASIWDGTGATNASSTSEILAADEMNLIARDGSHRRYMANAAFSDIPESPSPSDSEPPQLRIKSMTVSTRTLKENNGFYITKSFQFAEGNDMVVEDMTESVFTNEIPRQYLELLRTERADDLAHARADLADFETKCKTGLVGGLYDNLIDQIQGENDQTVVQSWLQDRVQRRRMYVDALRECHQVCIDRAEAGVNFKASTEKKSLVLRFLPINLHVQDMWVGPTADLRSQRTRRTSPNVKAYPTITVGAFAAHCYKFRHAGSILSLRSKLQKRTLSRLHSDQSDRGGSGVDNDQMDWTKAEVRSHDEILWQLTTRMDMCVSQALTALVTSFCRCLELALQHPTDRQFLQLIDSIGFLFQVESLLSTQGKEIGMLEDFSGSVEAMKNVSFILDTSPPRHLPSTLNLHLKNTNLPSVVSVRVSKGAASGAYIVVVGIRCKEEVLAHLPKNLRNGGSISVTPVMFTQGINEMQTLANNASGKKTNLQDTINQKSFRVLAAYIDKYTMLATKQPDAVPTPVSTILPLLVSLEERIKAAKKQVVKTKQTKIIQESSRLCRLLGAGRVTSCKSAKDRTGMSVTLEQIQLLSEHHGLPQEFVIRTVSTMRSNGVRLENAFKNTGKRQYAFNALQRSLLPEEYKCPEGTYGRGQVS